MIPGTIKYMQPQHVSPFTPYELVWVAGSGGWTHTHIANDTQRRGWGVDRNGTPAPSTHLFIGDEDNYFDSPVEAVEFRLSIAEEEQVAGVVHRHGCDPQAFRELLAKLKEAG